MNSFLGMRQVEKQLILENCHGMRHDVVVRIHWRQ